MSWRRIGDKPLPEPMMNDPVHWRIYAALGGDELANDCLTHLNAHFWNYLFLCFVSAILPPLKPLYFSWKHKRIAHDQIVIPADALTLSDAHFIFYLICGALMFHLICAWINGLANNRYAGDLRRDHAHYDVNVMKSTSACWGSRSS